MGKLYQAWTGDYADLRVFAARAREVTGGIIDFSQSLGFGFLPAFKPSSMVMSRLEQSSIESAFGRRHRPVREMPLRFMRLRDPSVVTPALPVLEHSVIQLAPGEFMSDSLINKFADVTMLYSRIYTKIFTTIRPKSELYYFYIPCNWTGEHRINGKQVRSSAIYSAHRDDGFHILGGTREGLAIALPRDRFAAAIATLLGVDAPDTLLKDGELEIGLATKRYLVSTFQRLLEQGANVDARKAESEGPDIVANQIINLMADAFLIGAPRSELSKCTGRSQSKIVRRAENFFASSSDQSVSISALCRACNVGKDGLYIAFRNITGETPTKYFLKRRLMQARMSLCKSLYRRGAVTRAALDAGLTELGRFSVEYRKIFGEAPSATLRAQKAPAASSLPKN